MPHVNLREKKPSEKKIERKTTDYKSVFSFTIMISFDTVEKKKKKKPGLER